MHTFRFVEAQAGMVARGEKRRTIRPALGTRPAPGDALRLTTGRPRFTHLLDATCAAVDVVALRVTKAGRLSSVKVNGDDVADLEAFAALDGFASAAAMGKFFLKLRGAGVFRGVMVQW